MATLPIIPLNDTARQYRDFLQPFKRTALTTLSGEHHVDGSRSLYVLTIVLRGPEVHKFFYVGQTGNPRSRLSNHKYTLLSCTTTTFNAKSRLYDPRYLTGLLEVHLDLEILVSGLKIEEAKEMEKERSNALYEQHGEYVLTNPNKDFRG